MVKTLAKSLRRHKKGSIFTVLLSIAEAGFEILIPLCMAELIDKGIDIGNMSAVWKYGIILLAFAVFQLVTGILSARIAAKHPLVCRKFTTRYVRQRSDFCVFEYR